MLGHPDFGGTWRNPWVFKPSKLLGIALNIKKLEVVRLGSRFVGPLGA